MVCYFKPETPSVHVAASAEDELYRVCRVRGRNTRTAVTSNEIIADEVTVDTLMFKFDMTNKTFRNHRNPTMTGFSVKGDKLIQNEKLEGKNLRRIDKVSFHSIHQVHLR